MLETLANPILPIYMVLAIGAFLRLGGALQASDAVSINRFAFYLGVPALIISVLGKAPIAEFEWGAIFAYTSVQIMLYVATFLLLYKVFKLEVREAMLLGMASSFVNHIFFVLPIAERLVGENASIPMAGILMFDAGVIFPTTVVITAILTAKGRGRANIAGMLLKNPFVYAPGIGLIIGQLGDAAPRSIMTFAEFGGAAASPVLLFVLGISLAGSDIRRIGGAVWAVVGIKLLVHPILVWGLLGTVAASQFTNDITLLVAAGPCGAMPLVIATQYGVKTDRIAKAMLISTTLSILSLAVLTS